MHVCVCVCVYKYAAYANLLIIVHLQLLKSKTFIKCNSLIMYPNRECALECFERGMCVSVCVRCVCVRESAIVAS